MIYPVFDCQVRTPFESFDLALDSTVGLTLGSTQRSTVDDEHALAFCIDYLVALALVRVAIVRVVWGSDGGGGRPDCLNPVEPVPITEAALQVIFAREVAD